MFDDRNQSLFSSDIFLLRVYGREEFFASVAGWPFPIPPDPLLRSRHERVEVLAVD